MHLSQNAAEQFGILLQAIVKDAVSSAIQAQPLTPVPPPVDRIGGIKLFCEVTGMAAQTGYNLASKREVPHSKRGGKLIFSETELRAWLLENRQPTRAEAVKNAHRLIGTPRRNLGNKR